MNIYEVNEEKKFTTFKEAIGNAKEICRIWAKDNGVPFTDKWRIGISCACRHNVYRHCVCLIDDNNKVIKKIIIKAEWVD